MTETTTTTTAEQVSGDQTVTVADVTSALVLAHGTALAKVEADSRAAAATLADHEAFTHAALVTRAAITAGLSLRKIGAANRAAKVGYTAAEDIRVLGMVGDIMNIPGDLPSGVTSRDIRTLYGKQITRKGADKLKVGPSAEQHAAILASPKSTDLGAAYRLVLDAVRENTASAKGRQTKQAEQTAAAQSAAESTEQAEQAEQQPEDTVDGPIVTRLLADLLLALKSGHAVTDEDRATLAECVTLAS